MQGIEQVVGETAYDAAGNKVGSVGNLYTSDTTGNPEWVTVNTGLFGSKHTFVPLAGARVETDGLHLAPSKSKIKDAPRIDSNGHLSEREASELYRYYGLTLPQRKTSDRTKASGRPTAAGDQPMPEADGKMRAGGTGDDQMMRDGAGDNQMMPAGDNSMVRSEERLRAGTETVETGRVNLHKHVVTEEQQVTVPVSHEEVHVVREPMAKGERGTAEIGDAEQEVVLHEERAVVAKETVPVERVGLETETVRGEEHVSETVRKEQVDVEGLPDDTRKAGGGKPGDSKHRKH